MCLQVAKNAKLAQLSGSSLYRIMLGVYATVGQGSDGIYCPLCFSTDVNKYQRPEFGRPGNPSYTESTCVKCNNSFSLDKVDQPTPVALGKTLKPPTIEDLRAWASSMSLGLKAIKSGEWIFKFPTGDANS